MLPAAWAARSIPRRTSTENGMFSPRLANPIDSAGSLRVGRKIGRAIFITDGQDDARLLDLADPRVGQVTIGENMRDLIGPANGTS